MTNTEQLQALRDKIAAGEADYTDLMQSPFNKRKNGWHLWELIFWSQQPDDLRAIGAAIAFTEAVAPECEWSVDRMSGPLYEALLESGDMHKGHYLSAETEHLASPAIALVLARCSTI